MDSQSMKPLTAADKLGIYLPATPDEFRAGTFTRADLERLRSDPPQWLTDLRRDGPFPRDTTASKLGVSNSGLARSGVGDALTAQQIADLDADPPEWLVRERKNYQDVKREELRVTTARAEKRAASNRPPKNR